MFTLVLVFTIITTVALIIYFPLVWENLIFNFVGLPCANVPFYNGGCLNRYGVEWWFIATDIFRWIPIFYLYIMLALPLATDKPDGKSWAIVYKVIMIFGAVAELVKFIYYAIMLITFWGIVSVLPNCTTSGCTGYNFVYWLIFGYSLGFFFWLLIWAFALSGPMLEYFESKNRKMKAS